MTVVSDTGEVCAVGAVGLGQIYGDNAFSRGAAVSYVASRATWFEVGSSLEWPALYRGGAVAV